MKKLLLLFLTILSLGSVFQSCSNSKTYAEMLEDERKAVRRFISNHNIKTISQNEFEKDTITDWENNQYALLNDGVYLQIIDRGDGDTIVSRNDLTIRMLEYNVMCEIESNLLDTISNLDYPYGVDSFIYNPTSSSVSFSLDGYFPSAYQQSMDVPQGIISVIPYLRSNARFKLIVPSKKGHSYAMQYVYPYYYDVHSLKIW